MVTEEVTMEVTDSSVTVILDPEADAVETTGTDCVTVTIGSGAYAQ